jgi:hypothetical protein
VTETATKVFQTVDELFKYFQSKGYITRTSFRSSIRRPPGARPVRVAAPNKGDWDWLPSEGAGVAENGVLEAPVPLCQDETRTDALEPLVFRSTWRTRPAPAQFCWTPNVTLLRVRTVAARRTTC